MGATVDRTADLPLEDQPSKASSFFSRWTLPLRSRTRNLADFHVRPDEPHRQYSAGDHVTGSIVLTVIKPVRITHLTVALHGFVRVFKNAGAAAQLAPINPAHIPHDGNKNFRYYGNGQASLFQDEQVLCGEGRLAARKWEFKFDLIFPSKGLPSSIDFERGTISYMITATLTRPTTMAPTTSVERKISLIEKVDIGLLSPPRERNVTMQAMHKRAKRKRTANSAATGANQRDSASTDTPEPASDMDSTRANENSNDGSATVDDHSRPLYDGLGARSAGESAASNASNYFRGTDVSAGSVNGSKYSGPVAEVAGREITATVELLKGGCLPGDLLPVRIKIHHNRRIKSLHGIIVTFYRQGRVDYAPPASMFKELSEEDAKRLEREEYYPKSKTGLGGLSLSSAGSCSVFRKDLSQSVAPLIIDPTSLSANITTSVRVPEDVFPSIRGVPGGLISFKYYVEVVIDLGGRLAGQTQLGSQPPGRMGSVSVPAGPVSPLVGSHENNISRLANWNGTIVDTDHIRREKGVIYVPIEVVVGSVDSNRTRGKAVARPTLTLESPSNQGFAPESDQPDYTWQNAPEDEYYDETGEYISPFEDTHSYFPSPHTQPTSYHDLHRQESHRRDSQEPQAPAYVAPPQIPDQTALTDKERVRQAEMRLLPSQPPLAGSESAAGPSRPSAPSAPGDHSSSTTGATGPSFLPPIDLGDSLDGPSAPTLTDLSLAASSHPTEDKQEMERRRLLEEASAPPDVPEEYTNGGPSAPVMDAAGPSGSHEHEPSAPNFDEGGSYGSHDILGNIAGPSNGHPLIGTIMGGNRCQNMNDDLMPGRCWA
ncbi:Arrestin [Apiospora aurea]|uniref:Arrestin n=1 Tax=Apiospora aurea TaxID=335848 RepID=A0ABR1QEL8_9PEZI